MFFIGSRFFSNAGALAVHKRIKHSKQLELEQTQTLLDAVIEFRPEEVEDGEEVVDDDGYNAEGVNANGEGEETAKKKRTTGKAKRMAKNVGD